MPVGVTVLHEGPMLVMIIVDRRERAMANDHGGTEVPSAPAGRIEDQLVTTAIERTVAREQVVRPLLPRTGVHAPVAPVAPVAVASAVSATLDPVQGFNEVDKVDATVCARPLEPGEVDHRVIVRAGLGRHIRIDRANGVS